MEAVVAPPFGTDPAADPAARSAHRAAEGSVASAARGRDLVGGRALRGRAGFEGPALSGAVRTGDNALVAKITSKYHDERPGVIALPPGAVGDAQGRPSFLETDELREVPVSDFRRKVGMADPVLWDRVRHLAR